MRELKFRAWDGQKMFIPDLISNKSYSQGQAAVFPKYSNEPRIIEAVVMQFIGIKDCTGKDIYEGDLVQQMGSGEIAPVIWQPFHQFHARTDDDNLHVLSVFLQNSR